MNSCVNKNSGIRGGLYTFDSHSLVMKVSRDVHRQQINFEVRVELVLNVFLTCSLNPLAGRSDVCHVVREFQCNLIRQNARLERLDTFFCRFTTGAGDDNLAGFRDLHHLRGFMIPLHIHQLECFASLKLFLHRSECQPCGM